MRNKLFFIASLLIVASMVLGACATPQPETVEVVKTVVVTEVVEVEGETIIETQIVEVPAEVEEVAEPVTLNWNWTTEPPSADPSLATDTTLTLSLVKNYPIWRPNGRLARTRMEIKPGPSNCVMISLGLNTTPSPAKQLKK